MKINEIFRTIQSEGTHAGTPSIFLRTQFCDVGCPWCDTKNTWEAKPADKINIEGLAATGSKSDNIWASASPTQVIREVNKIAGPTDHIVITGGEPLAQDDLIDFINIARSEGYNIQIETSGTYYQDIPIDVWVTVSPKIGMKRVIDERMIWRANEIKMPVGKESDIINLKALLKDNKAKPVYLQPLSTSPKATELCITSCLENNWKLSVQTHKYINIP